MEPVIGVSPYQGAARPRVSVNLGFGRLWSIHLELSDKKNTEELAKCLGQ